MAEEKKILGHRVVNLIDGEIDSLKHRIIYLENWNALKNKKEGKFLMEYYESKLAIIMSEYSHVDMTKSEALQEIARIQGKESVIREEIEDLKSLKNISKGLDERLKDLIQIKKAQGTNPRTGGIVSKNAKGKTQ